MVNQRQLPDHARAKLLSLYRTAVQDGIPLESIQQRVEHFSLRKLAVDSAEAIEQKQRSQQTLKQKFFFTGLPALFVVVGMFFIGLAAWPLISYTLFPASHLDESSLLLPVPREQAAVVVPQIVVQAQGSADVTEEASTNQQKPYVAPTILDDELDYTNLSNWFPNLSLTQSEGTSIQYLLDIPTLNIHNAKVQLGGSNLDRNLIQYPGTAMPGDPGNPVIFGHSILRQFYNPSEKNPNRYLSIFSTIMTLKPGERIYLTTGGVKYAYEVVEKQVVHPDNTSILEQRYDQRELKLVTCVPEGTIKDRGIVIARLVKE